MQLFCSHELDKLRFRNAVNFFCRFEALREKVTFTCVLYRIACSSRAEYGFEELKFVDCRKQLNYTHSAYITGRVYSITALELPFIQHRCRSTTSVLHKKKFSPSVPLQMKVVYKISVHLRCAHSAQIKVRTCSVTSQKLRFM